MAGKARPSSSAVREAPTTGARSAVDLHVPHRHATATRPHHRHWGSRSAPPSASGPGQNEHLAGVRQRAQARAGTYPPRGTWIEHRPEAQGGADDLVGAGREPSTPGRVGVLVLSQRRLHERRDPAHGRPRGSDRARPALPDQLGGLGGHREAADERGRSLGVRPQQEDVTHVRVGSAWLLVEVVAVVPHHDEAQVVHRGEGRGARADDHPAHAPADCEPAPVALGGTEVGGQPCRDASAQEVVDRVGRRGRRRGGRAPRPARPDRSRRTPGPQLPPRPASGARRRCAGGARGVRTRPRAARRRT